MPRHCTTREDLDDDHATAAAWTSGLAGIDIGTGRLAVRFCNGEQLTRMCDVVSARAAGEQAIVADAVEAFWQHVDQEAADKLAGGQCHDLLALATIGTIVLPSEGNAVVADCDQSAVGDGDAVGIARQIGQHGLRPTERALGIDDPLGPTQRCQIRHERLRVGEGGMIAEELQTADLMVYSTIS